MRSARRQAFTLIELLVVIAIIGVLMALLLPALNAVKQAALRTQCQSNMKQMGLALLAYHETVGSLPPAIVLIPDRFNTNGGKPLPTAWSAQTRILPFLEAKNTSDLINFDVSYETKDANGVRINGKATSVNVGIFICPSDVNADRQRIGSDSINVNYVVNRGDWYIWGGFSPTDNPSSPQWKNIPVPRAPFYVNSSVRTKDITDGTSKTMLVSEVKSYTAAMKKCSDLVYAPTNPSNPIPLPNLDPATITQYQGCTGGSIGTTSHTEWQDGQAFETGFTTAWPPNTKTSGKDSAGVYPDIDLVSVTEKNGGPTYGAITARSFHSGGVNAFFADGSVQFISDGINGDIWRAMGTIAEGDISNRPE